MADQSSTMQFAMSLLDNLDLQAGQHLERAILQMRRLTLRRGARDATVLQAWDMMYDQVLTALEVIGDTCEESVALAIQEEMDVARAAAAVGWPAQPPQQPGSLFMFNDNVRGVNHDLKAGHPKVNRGSTRGQPRVEFL